MNVLNWIHRLFSKKSSRRPIRRNAPRLAAEQLEDRIQPAALVESIDGTGNNLVHPTWGSAGADLSASPPPPTPTASPRPAGADRPSARVDQQRPRRPGRRGRPHQRPRPVRVHLRLGPVPRSRPRPDHRRQPGREPFNIPVPTGDPSFDPAGTGTQVIPLNRSHYDPPRAPARQPAPAGQRDHRLARRLDGLRLRRRHAPPRCAPFVGGQDSKTSAGNLLPFNTTGLPTTTTPTSSPTTSSSSPATSAPTRTSS